MFFLFLLLIVPLQSSWAAVSVYCQHEQGRAAHHLGHHEHKHQAADAEPADKNNPAKTHGDCAYCHLAAQVWFSTLPTPAVPAPGATHLERHLFSYTSHIADGPRRPDRHPVA